MHKLWRELQVETPIVVGAVEANPGNRDTVLGQKVWMSWKYTFSCCRAVTRFADSLFKLYVDAIAYYIATSIAGSSSSGRATPIRLPNVMHHNSGDTSNNCQVSVHVDKYCDLVGFPDLCTSRSHVQGQVSKYISLMTESYSS